MNKLNNFDWWIGIIFGVFTQLFAWSTASLSGFFTAVIVYWLCSLIIKNVFE